MTVALIPALLFSSITLGLHVPRFGHPGGKLPGGPDYSRRALGAIPPLRSPYLQDVLGGLIGSAAPPGLGYSPAGGRTARPDVPPPDVTHPLTNDNFRDAYRIPSVPYRARTNDARATRESTEPTSCAPVGTHTVWYQFDAPSSIGLIADTFGTDHPVTLGVFTKDGKGALDQVSRCSTSPQGNASVPFPATDHRTYYFQIASVSGGALVFDLRPQGVTKRFSVPGFALAVGGGEEEERYWGFTGIEDGTDTEGCVGFTAGIPFVPPEACRMQVYVLDRTSGRTTLVSIASDGTAANDVTLGGVLSAGGRYVMFASFATNLVPHDRNTCWVYRVPGQCPDIFVHDRDADGNGIFDETFPGGRRTIRVSVSSDGAEGKDWSWPVGGMSRDGRFVGMQSRASNLVAGDTNGVSDAFVFDRDADGDGIFDEEVPGARRMIRVSVSSSGRQAEDVTRVPDLNAIRERRDYFPFEHGNHILGTSTNGRYALFRSPDPNLVPGDTNEAYDVFLRDIVAGTTVRVNVSSEGVQADKGTRLKNDFASPISDDGRYVIFNSDATNLVPNDTNKSEDLFLRDVTRGTTERLTVDWRGREVQEPPAPVDAVVGGVLAVGSVLAWNGEIFPLSELNHAISGNGRYVVFSSGAQLVPEDLDEQRDIYIRDLRWGTVSLISVSTCGEKGNASSNLPAISRDGRTVGFSSSSSNLDNSSCDRPAGVPGVVSAGYLRFLPESP